MNSRRYGSFVSGLGSLALLVGMSACGGSSAGGGSVGGGQQPPQSGINSIAMYCKPTVLLLTGRGTCYATALDSKFQEISPQPKFEFTSSAADKVSVNAASGNVTGVAAGSAQIVASVSAAQKSSLPVTIIVEPDGTMYCGGFSINSDAAGNSFNGESRDALLSATIPGTINVGKTVLTLTCTRQATLSGKLIERKVSVNLTSSSVIFAGQAYYPADIAYTETDLTTPCGTGGCPVKQWRNTKSPNDLQVRSISGNTYRVTYSVVLAPTTPATGNLVIYGDVTSTPTSN